VRGAALGRGEGDPDDADEDRRHGEVLAPAGALVEHPLADEHQHQQAAGERRLHDDERREQQRDHLQREAENGQRRARQPACAHGELPQQADAQVVLGVHLARVERLKGNP
jgi:hypothetical protein